MALVCRAPVTLPLRQVTTTSSAASLTEVVAIVACSNTGVQSHQVFGKQQNELTARHGSLGQAPKPKGGASRQSFFTSRDSHLLHTHNSQLAIEPYCQVPERTSYCSERE